MGFLVLYNDIKIKLATYTDPYLRQDLFSANAIKTFSVKDRDVYIEITLGYPCKSLINCMKHTIESLLDPVITGHRLHLSIQQKIEPHAGPKALSPLPNIKNIIAIGSGKGGVGKSTVAVNLAIALAQDATVGLLDADVYGPSVPTMLGTVKEKPETRDNALLPIERHGLQTMSIGYLIGDEAPMVWRGPMLAKALQQIITDTKWRDLDYLIVDLPPGTGDIQLTLSQKFPLSAAVIVTTPQDLALVDVRRACTMFNKVDVPILGVIENMSSYHCSACGHEEKIFGAGGAKKLAKDFAIDLLGEIPLNLEIRTMTDQGEPPALQADNHPQGEIFMQLARRIAAKLSLQAKSYSSTFPKIVVEKK